jgi:protoporphyrinogen oxidase
MTQTPVDAPPELVILGGGPAGIAVAFYAQRAGIRFALYERSLTYGGLCRTLRCGDHLYDSGAHRFHDRDAEVTQDVRSLLGDELVRVTAPSQIYDHGRFIDFPPTPLGLVRSTGLRDAGRIGAEIIGARLRRTAESASFADFAVRRFGRTLARRLLLDYSEKLWGLPADQLSPDIATRRLHGMTVRSLLTELIVPGRKAAHIDGEFLYPRGGYGRIAERLIDCLPAAALHAGCEVTGIECHAGAVRRIHFARLPAIEVAGRVVSTLPLTLLVNLLGDNLANVAREAAARLRFRHIRLVFLRLAQHRVTPNASIYLPDQSLCVSRVSEPRNRSPEMAPQGETSLVAEVPCFPGDPLHQLADEAMARRVIDDLVSTGLIDRSRVLDWRHHLLPNAYPVYSLDYAQQVKTILDALSQLENLDTVGRGGRFFYTHLHDQMRFGRDYVMTRRRGRVMTAAAGR